MAAKSNFKGFPEEAVEFYEELVKNNTKEWFDAHKQDYERFVLEPARDFVYEMGKLLKKIAPGVVADPRVNQSIFRINRDTRFSKDKTPYKTHLGIFLWEGEGKRMDNSGYYFHLEPPSLMLAAGMHCFSKHLMTPYRDAVVDPKNGPALAKALSTVQKNNDLQLWGKHYKKTPRGYDANHKNAELLLFNGLAVGETMPIPPEFYSAELPEFCLKKWKGMAPVHKWLVGMAADAAPST